MPLLTGAKHWKSWEKSLWSMSLIFAALWVVYVLITDILLFDPVDYGREQTYAPKTYGSGDESNQIGDLGRIMMGEKTHDLTNSIDQTTSEARSTRNMLRKNAERNANEGYVFKGLAKAIGPVLGWFGFLFGFFSFIEMYEKNDGDIEKKG